MHLDVGMAAGPASSWRPTVSPSLARQAIQVAHSTARHLRDPQRVARAVAATPAQTAFPRTIHWQPFALAQGEAGIALACAYLDACFPDEGWDRIGHSYLAGAAIAAQSLPGTALGLFGGLAGVAFAAWSLSRGGTRYRHLLATIDDALLAGLTARIAHPSGPGAQGLSFGEFDVITGLAGVGAYLLCRRDNPAAEAALDSVLRYLVELAGDASARPRWWTPASALGDTDIAALHPYGNLNCGLAHGIPGPLALMAMARSHRIAVPRLAEAIECAATWLVTHRADDAWGVNWPFAVALTADGLPDFARAARAPCRTAWCYGAPGIARTLWLAGVALDQPQWRQLAIDAMTAVHLRPPEVRNIDSPTFCHGVAGLLQITLRFAHDTGLPAFAAAAADLAGWIVSAYEPDSLLGYRNWEPGGARIDQAGLLDGAPGVVLALLAASTNVEPAWDRAFMLV